MKSMKSKKSLWCSLFCLAVLFSVVACDDDATPGDNTTDTTSQTDTTNNTSPDTNTTDTGENPDSNTADTNETPDTQTAEDTQDIQDADVVTPPAPAPYCVGIRGNGELVFAHFAALARITEHYGVPVGVAGGSSASITSFLLESISMNPAVEACAGAPCDPAQAGVRAAFLFKSIPAYAAFLGSTEEGQAFTQLVPVIQQAMEQGIGDLFNTDVSAARDALVALFESEEIADLINPEALSLITESPDSFFHAQEMYNALVSFGSFAAGDDIILIRPGIINFAGLAEKVGRIGSFYAGYGAADGAAWEALMATCADGTRGQSWTEIAAKPFADGVTCQDAFLGAVAAWRADWVANESTYHSRVDDEVGASLPALISTSVLTGDTLVSWAQAKDAYFAAEPYTFTPSFDDVSFGYWGQAADLTKVAANAEGYTDEKTARFRNLGQATWRTALSMSPAEPGLSRAVAIDATQLSAGGWSDLHPVLVLRNLGCENVIYLTRRGGESGFAQGVAALLGMDATTGTALYDLSAQSSFRTSLEEADGVWCTDWNSFSGTQIQEISLDGYTAPFETSDPAFTDAENAYENTTAQSNFPGCTPGVAVTP